MSGGLKMIVRLSLLLSVHGVADAWSLLLIRSVFLELAIIYLQVMFHGSLRTYVWWPVCANVYIL